MRDLDALMNELQQSAPAQDATGRNLDALMTEINQGTAPSSFSGRMSQATSDAWSGVQKGAGDAVSGFAAIPGAVMGIPSQVLSDLTALFTDPKAAIPAQAKRAASFAWGMVPMAETIGKAITGEPLTVEGVAQDATRYGVSRFAPPVIGGAVKRAIPAVVKLAPGAGVPLHELAIEKADQLVARLTPGTQAVREIYQKASSMGNPKLDMAELRQAAEQTIAHEIQAVKPDTALISQAQNILESSETGWNWTKATSEIGRLGGQLKAIKRQLGEVPEEWTNLYRVMRNDMEQAKIHPSSQTPAANSRRPPTPPGEIPSAIEIASRRFLPPGELQAWTPPGEIPSAREIASRRFLPQDSREAIGTQQAVPTPQSLAQSAQHLAAQRLARTQFASEDLAQQINKALGVEGDAYNSFSVNKVIKWIQGQERAANLGHPDRAAKLFVESFTPADLEGIKSTLRTMSASLPALPTKTGAAVGSSQRLVQSISGEAVGHLVGAPPAVGALAGYVLADRIAAAIVTPAGRKMVVKLSQINPVTSPAFNTALGAWLRTHGYADAHNTGQ